MRRHQWAIVDYALSSCVIIIHIVGLIFLKHSNRHKNQMLIITFIPPSKVFKIVICLALLCPLTTVTFAVLIPLQTITWLQVYDVLYVLYLILDIGYIFLAAGTYSFIFQIYRRHLKFKKTSQISGKKDQFKLLIPTLIIATFILFNIIPNTINASYRHEIQSFDKTIM